MLIHATTFACALPGFATSFTSFRIRLPFTLAITDGAPYLSHLLLFFLPSWGFICTGCALVNTDTNLKYYETMGDQGQGLIRLNFEPL